MFGKLPVKAVYVKIYANRFVIKLAEQGATPVTIPAIEPFTTKRLLIGQFKATERVLTKGVKDLLTGKWLLLKPALVMHPLEKIEGGLSEVEERVLIELAITAGASKVTVWVGHELSDAEA